MKPHHPRTWTQAEIAQQALEMLAIGNVATQKAQQRKRAQGIANDYSIAGRMVSDVDAQGVAVNVKMIATRACCIRAIATFDR